MGALISSCESKEVRQQISINKAINHQLLEAKRAEKLTIKLLLLGAGECGKSTVMKQMQLMHMRGFTEQEIAERRLVIYSNILTAMVALLSAMEKMLGFTLGEERQLDRALIYKVMDAGEDSQPFTEEVAAALINLWADPTVRKVYEQRSKFQLDDSAKYFFDALPRIQEPGYRPTEQDILHSRVSTLGMVETKFHIKQMEFRVLDVGGQRSQRRKWIHCFDNVQAVIFITAISEYDQVLAEDETTNRMVESMRLFNCICNSPWFVDSAMIVFLNKKDLFAEKIKRVNITTCFINYKGAQNYEEALAFIKRRFAKLNKHPETMRIFFHESCATDSNQMQLVIGSALDTVIQKNLQREGLI